MRPYVLACATGAAGVALVGVLWLARGRGRGRCLHIAGARATAFRGARVFDGEILRARTDVLVVDGSIVGVGGFSCLDSGGATVEEVDASGQTLLPGLIDSLDRAVEQAPGEQEEARLEAMRFGVTTLVGTARPAGPGSTGAPPPAGSPGAEPANLADLVPASKQVADVATMGNASEAIAANAPGLAHWPTEEPAPQALVDAIVEKRMFVVPALGRMQMECGIPVGRQVLADPHIEPRLSEGAKAALAAGRGGRLGPRRLGCYANVLQGMALLHGRVPILAGTDAPGPGLAHGASLHRELELLVLAGLTPAEALRAATSVPAAMFGLSDRGRICPGARADLVLVNGDPSADILATRAIVRVYKQGVRAL
jgi:hypothetical protein